MHNPAGPPLPWCNAAPPPPPCSVPRSFAAPAEGATAEFHRILRYEVRQSHGPPCNALPCAPPCGLRPICRLPAGLPPDCRRLHGSRCQPACLPPLPPTPISCPPTSCRRPAVRSKLHHPSREGAGHFGRLRPAGAGARRAPGRRRQRRRLRRRQGGAGRCGGPAASAGAAAPTAGGCGCSAVTAAGCIRPGSNGLVGCPDRFSRFVSLLPLPSGLALHSVAAPSVAACSTHEAPYSRH